MPSGSYDVFANNNIPRLARWRRRTRIGGSEMTTAVVSAANGIAQPTDVQRGTRSRFFFGMSIVMLVLVFLGFAPSFFLHAFFGRPSLPIHLHVHGSVLTGWYAWFALQAFCVAAGRTGLHRRLGVFGVALAVGVVAAAAWTSLHFWPRMTQLGADIDPHLVYEIVWSNIANLLCFSTFVTAAVLLRHKPRIHKRLMLLASISILPPALTRIIDWPIWGAGEDAYFALLCVMVIPLAALAVHDVKENRAVHPVTLGGGAAFLVLFSLGLFGLPNTELGGSVVRGLYDLMR